MSRSINIKKMLENGLKALDKGNNDKALEIFDQIIKEDPKNTIAWNNRGVALRKLDRLEEAIDCYNKVLSMDSKQIQALLNKARALKIQRKFDLALFTYEDILDINPNNKEALFESEVVRSILSKGTQYPFEKDKLDQENEENKLLFERKKELSEFLQESIKSISDSIENIEKIFTSGIKEEALELRDNILAALITFNEQLQDRIKRITDEFTTIDFIEENRELIEQWNNFKNEKVEKLKKMK